MWFSDCEKTLLVCCRQSLYTSVRDAIPASLLTELMELNLEWPTEQATSWVGLPRWPMGLWHSESDSDCPVNSMPVWIADRLKTEKQSINPGFEQPSQIWHLITAGPQTSAWVQSLCRSMNRNFSAEACTTSGLDVEACSAAEYFSFEIPPFILPVVSITLTQ